MSKPLRNLLLVLGDQLDPASSAFDGFSREADVVWMAEVTSESTHVWSSKPRIALFLSAMRHFADCMRDAGVRVDYIALDHPDNEGNLEAELAKALRRWRPEQVIVTAPGDWRVLDILRETTSRSGIPLAVREDRHYLCTVREFTRHAHGRKQLRMEYFYREMRQRHQVLMEDGKPAGGRWNFDRDNRQGFDTSGPGMLPPSSGCPPDATTREVITLVNRHFSKHPGELDAFDWPVTRADALAALGQFISNALPAFGPWQDAMWPGQAFLWHSRLSAALNLKLLNPREVIAAAEQAWRNGLVPLASAEGFIRQILGWREYVRGIYWTHMPGYIEANAFGATAPLPAFYWTGETPMACLADAIGQTLRLGYAHHIQRLMVTGLYTLLLGVDPKEVHRWYLAVYVDAVEWVELPNTLGMSQAADAGLMASKPYIASGKYIHRMSGGSLCAGCRFDPTQRLGEHACPYTTLYWDFLIRHEATLAANPRMAMQVRNLKSIPLREREAIHLRAESIRSNAGIPPKNTPHRPD